MAQVAPGVVPEAERPLLLGLLARPFEAAEVGERPAPGLARGQAAAHALRGLHLDVREHLVAQLAVEAAAVEQGAQLEPEAMEPRPAAAHGDPSPSASGPACRSCSTAPVKRRQLVVSRSSWRRPVAVSA